jgi:hypothetical protein
MTPAASSSRLPRRVWRSESEPWRHARPGVVSSVDLSRAEKAKSLGSALFWGALVAALVGLALVDLIG